MKYADKIRMKDGFFNSTKQVEIDQIHIQSIGWFKKADIYDYIKYHNGIVKVNLYPYPTLIPVISISGEKYVRSTSNDLIRDNLMYLPREY